MEDKKYVNITKVYTKEEIKEKLIYLEEVQPEKIA